MRRTFLPGSRYQRTIPSLKTLTVFATALIALSVTPLAQTGDDPLPDRKLTPGRIARRDSDRHVITEEIERHLFNSYHIPWRRRAEFKIDHLIPIELGGADTIDNLWPQSLYVRPYDARRKELLTQHLLAQIAAGKMTLPKAQEEIREDWISCYVEHLGMVYLQ
jgi:hypothetical protein